MEFFYRIKRGVAFLLATKAIKYIYTNRIKDGCPNCDRFKVCSPHRALREVVLEIVHQIDKNFMDDLLTEIRRETKNPFISILDGDSMKPFFKNDIVLCYPLYRYGPDNLKVGDIISYSNWGDMSIENGNIVASDRKNYTICHRIVEINGNNLICKGDNNKNNDEPVNINCIDSVIVAKIKKESDRFYIDFFNDRCDRLEIKGGKI